MSDEPPKPPGNSDTTRLPNTQQTTNVSEDNQSDTGIFTLTSAISLIPNETTLRRATLDRPTASEEINRAVAMLYTQNESMDTKEKTLPPPYTESLYTDSQEVEINITPPPYPPIVLYSAPPLEGAPPTYSAIMRIGPIDIQPRRSFRLFGRREVRMQPSPPFIAPVPPPSYAECHGLITGRPVLAHSILDIHDPAWGITPVSITCPMCHNFVITTVHTRRSNVTHFSALALCICGCWPCCLLPYCMKSCKTSFHECPICLSIMGIYNPW